MTDDAIVFLTRLQSAVGELRSEPERFADWRMRNVHDLDDQLLRLNPFSTLAETWLFTGDGSGTVVSGMCASWSIDQLCAGITPQEIVTKLEKRLADNVLRVSEVSPVFGVRLADDLALSEGIILHVRPKDTWLHASADKPLFTGLLDPAPGCFLEQIYTVQPAFIKTLSRSESGLSDAETSPGYEARLAAREHVLAALLVVSSGPVEMPSCTRVGESNDVFGRLGVRHGSLHPRRLPHAVDVAPEAFLKMHSLLGKHESRDALMLAIHRLSDSRSKLHPSGRALDLGIAAEILLMHDSTDTKGEITNKISSRAAWLLGSTWEERLAISRKVRDIYHDRSSIVHKGHVSSPRLDAVEADLLVVQIITKLLELGRFPNWSKLVLGGPL